MLPKKVRPRPRARFREFVSLISISLRSIMVCRIVDVTSPLHVPIAIRPADTAAIPITLKKIETFLSMNGRKEGWMEGRKEGEVRRERGRGREKEKKQPRLINLLLFTFKSNIL